MTGGIGDSYSGHCNSSTEASPTSLQKDPAHFSESQERDVLVTFILLLRQNTQFPKGEKFYLTQGLLKFQSISAGSKVGWHG